MTPTRQQLLDAVETLAGSERGRECLRDIRAMLNRGADGLDGPNQYALMMVFACQFGPFGDSTREVITRALTPKRKKPRHPVEFENAELGDEG